MTLLPSPIPHPLDYSPWDLPGWMYDALDWVVGVEWPDGDERAVWDLADQWYAVAATLAGPHADAVAAAAEVRGGYGGVGAVEAAFDGAWRRIAEGDDAALPALLAVSHDLGRLVEECGCDIEGAKLEVWIELGILVVELIGLAVATVLTAGAASPAAAAAIAATRVIVQQIFRRLLAQLARKTLKRGLKEVGERAAKEVAEGGVRGFARRAAAGGLSEAAEESGITLATQAYQNSTGRRHGLDVTDLTASAVGGLAGGAVAPLAGLGRHATGRGARIGEHVAREMTGEVLAEQAASLATGQGPASVEEAVRAAVSGARGSVTTQADAALHARLDGRLDALAGMPSAVPGPDGSSALLAGAAGPTAAGAVPVDAVVPTQRAGDGPTAAVAPAPVIGGEASTGGTRAAEPTSPGVGDGALAADASRSGVPSSVDRAVPETPPSPASPTLSSVADGPSAPVTGSGAAPAVSAPSLAGSGAAGPPASSSTGPAAVTTGPLAHASHTGPSAAGPVAPATAGQVAPVTAGPAGPVGAGPNALIAPGPGVPVTAGLVPLVAAVPVPPVTGPTQPGPLAQPGPVVQPGPVPQPGPVVQPLAGPTAPAPAPPPTRAGGAPQLPPPSPPLDAGFAPPLPPLDAGFAPPLPPVPPPLPPRDEPLVARPAAPRPRTPEWYAARWAADQDAFERRRYRGHFEHQRTNHEENRRRDRAEQLRYAADRAYDEARWLLSESRRLGRAGYRAVSDQLFTEGRDRERWCHRQRDLAEAVLAGTVAPGVVTVTGEDFERINDDVGDLARGPVRVEDRSALTGDDHPPPIDRSRPYDRRGGLRPPLALHQRDVERQVPRRADGTMVRTPDPRVGSWFRLLNDGGPQADPTRGINCVDCTLSLFETWVHGRPRVSAPRTFDAYALGDVTRPLNGEANGPGRIEDVTGGRFQRLCQPPSGTSPDERARVLDTGYRNLRDQLLVGGHGSFAFVINQWEGGGSHIWVALNQNGSILYLDPQSGEIADRPLGRHRGVPHPYNAVDVDVLVIGGDGAPMPLAGLQRGLFSQRPDLPAYPPATEHQGYGEPYLNRLHLLASPGSAEPPAQPRDERPGGAEQSRASDARLRDQASEDAQPGTAGLSDRTGRDLTALLASVAGDGSAVGLGVELRAAAPHLDEQAAGALAEVLGDARTRSMFEAILRDPERYKPRFADTLLRQLIEAPDLVRIVHTIPELLASLTARPVTLHHLAGHPQAVNVLGGVLAEIDTRGVDAFGRDMAQPDPTPLTAVQRARSLAASPMIDQARQPGFDARRKADAGYRREFLNLLYRDSVSAQEEVDALAEHIASCSEGAVATGRREPKDRKRANDKIVKYRGDVSLLTDLAAARTTFQTLSELYLAFGALLDDDSIRIVECEDRFLRPQLSGYRDIRLCISTSNGHVAEFRLELRGLTEVAEWEHALYEVRRDMQSIAEEEGRTMSSMERAIWNGVIAQEQRHFWRALQAAVDGVV
ncbi:toxin glutamine deamidase domain-containing protein [Micromonospora sp. NPDC126480]|uniref:toxin glutamine deamidase domain-containing protein n=1 Tax=Micromonospora sp. NPDC126480 TaxID=3155312 RepID=UPI003329B3CF